MRRIMTVSKAKDDVKVLQEYIALAESYEINASMEKLIIKEYAFTINIAGVQKKLNSRGLTIDGRTFVIDNVVKVITNRTRRESQAGHQISLPLIEAEIIE